MEQQSSELETQYTVVPIVNPDHQQKLHKYVNTEGKLKNKSSLCRFYLRGICIMKPEFCKFAHSVDELVIDFDESVLYLNDKEKKKREFIEKKEFNQQPLFILNKVNYLTLYQFQFSERYKKSKIPIIDIDSIATDRAKRVRIRELLQRQAWDQFIEYLEKKYPSTNFPVSFLSFWFATFGFDKPQTRCRFGDFLKYITHVRGYIEVNIVFPPNILPSIYLINSKSKETILEQNAQQIFKLCMEEREQENKEKEEEFISKSLPEELAKKYICRYFMAGNCQLKAEECLYAHSISELKENYELNQVFPVEYRQPIMPVEKRMELISLFEQTRKYEDCEEYTYEDIKMNSALRNELRQKVHYEIFRDFLNFLEEVLPVRENSEEKFFHIQLRDLQRYYNGAGFNQTNENKFQHFEASLWNLGYYTEDTVVKDENTLEKKKLTFVYKIPPLEYLNNAYSKIIKECVSSEIENLSEEGILLESALRRAVYSQKSTQILPLHIYLRLRGVSFQEIVTEFCTKEESERIFFESGEENLKKLIEIVKKYMKKNKVYIVKIEDIEAYIKNEKRDEVNFNNHFLNVKSVIQSTIVEMGKKVYFWPFVNNAFAIDPSLLAAYKKTKLEPKNKTKEHEESLISLKTRLTEEEIAIFGNQRIIVVDSMKALMYAEKYLSKCATLGVDLEGKLKNDGYIDLVQVSGVKRKSEDGSIEHKHIFIFDIWLMMQDKKCEGLCSVQSDSEETKPYEIEISELLIETKKLLKGLFENSNKVKILHDCRQDSIALKYLLGINLQNVFDTSGFDVYISQKRIYENKEEKLEGVSLVRKIYDVKVPGLNTILDSYKAPNGVNIFKESMKKKFGDPNNRSYFELRPIDQEFLEYSARDVEDLIEVYDNMIVEDVEGLSEFIGGLYSSC